MKIMDYLKLLTHSFGVQKKCYDSPLESRLEFLSEYIFNFTTYDSEMSKLFCRKAVEVCAAINDGTTYEYIKDTDNYQWFLIMCNMPFFENKLSWGCSIRGAWWSVEPRSHFEIDSCGLWDGKEQIIETMKFSEEEWRRFIAAVIAFVDLWDGKERRKIFDHVEGKPFAIRRFTTWPPLIDGAAYGTEMVERRTLRGRRKDD